jgi:hypothetical protein
MRRTIETAQLSLSWLINKGVRLEADARWQGAFIRDPAPG